MGQLWARCSLGFREPHSQVDPEKMIICSPIRVPPITQLGMPGFHPGAPQIPQYFRPCPQGLLGWKKGSFGSIQQALSGSRPHDAWRRTKAKAAVRTGRSPPTYIRFRGVPGAEALSKPGLQTRPSYSLPASLSMDNAPEKTGREPGLHSSHCAAVTKHEKRNPVTPPVGDLAPSGSGRGPYGPALR